MLELWLVLTPSPRLAQEPQLLPEDGLRGALVN